jgi:hypothetical protein
LITDSKEINNQTLKSFVGWSDFAPRNGPIPDDFFIFCSRAGEVEGGGFELTAVVSPALPLRPSSNRTDGFPRAAKPQPRMNWPQENTKIARKKRHKFFSLSSLCAFAAKSSWNWVIPHCGAAEGLGFVLTKGILNRRAQRARRRGKENLCVLCILLFKSVWEDWRAAAALCVPMHIRLNIVFKERMPTLER